jgi:hypothetical protein
MQSLVKFRRGILNDKECSVYPPSLSLSLSLSHTHTHTHTHHGSALQRSVLTLIAYLNSGRSYDRDTSKQQMHRLLSVIKCQTMPKFTFTCFSLCHVHYMSGRFTLIKVHLHITATKTVYHQCAENNSENCRKVSK